MRKYLFPSLLILACFAGGALSQNITRSMQVSQDPTGKFGVDTNNGFYLAQHLLTQQTPAPTLSGCGTSPSILGSDVAGKLTTGSAATTCTVTFATAYVTAPACVVQTQGGATQPTFTTTTTTIAITVDIASTVYNYICVSQS
jgi:hypothetical protein